MTSYPLHLTISQKDTFDDIKDELKQFEWEVGEYVFQDFTEYFQLPQIVRVSQTWGTNLVKDDILHLQTTYDRHLILAKSLIPDNRTFIFPDWFQGKCRIVSSNPKYRARWWEFHNIMELLRFELPREHIRLRQDTLTQLLLPTNQTVPVLLKQNTEVTLKRIEKSATTTNGKEMFILMDNNEQEFLLNPNDITNGFHFAAKILDNEFDQTYYSITTDSLFTLPEILIRYELPIDIEIMSLTNTIPIENFPTKLRLEKYSIAKSILAFLVNSSDQLRILELSSLTQFSVHCVKCLTVGLPRDPSIYEEPRPFDEHAYRHYEHVRTRIGQLFEEVSMQYMCTPFVGKNDEIEAIEKVYDIGVQLSNEQKHQTYVVLDQVNSTNNQESMPTTIPSIKHHPARFTVHLLTDFNSPYGHTIEINDNNEDEHEIAT